MDPRHPPVDTTQVPDVAHTPLASIDNTARRVVLRRVLGAGQQVPMASFQSRI